MNTIEPVITDLFVYPIKSCRGIRREEVRIDSRGIEGDRRWMVVEAGTGRFVTQREYPELARVIPSLMEDRLHLIFAEQPMRSLEIPRRQWEQGDSHPFTIFKRSGIAIDQGDDVAEHFSALLHKPARLVYLPDSEILTPNRRPSGVETSIAFSDGYPFLLTTARSLDEVNTNLPPDHPPILPTRFRPNIIARGTGQPWIEETWNQFHIRDIPFYGVKPCERCVVTQVDQIHGARLSKEPLTTLARIHRMGNATIFGINLIHAATGRIQIGDRIQDIILGERPAI